MPVPEVVNIIHSHENPLYEGATFSLICVISPNKTGVDIDFKVQKNFSGPVISASTLFDTVISGNNIQISMMFAPLSMNDTGTYECSAMISSILPNVTTSDSVTNDTAVSILRKAYALHNKMLKTFFM